MISHGLLLVGMLLGADAGVSPGASPPAGAATAPAASAGSASAAPVASNPFAGTYKFSDDAKEKAARDAAIAESTNGVFFLIRGAVGARVNDKTAIAPDLTFAFQQGKVYAIRPGRPDIITPDDGSVVPVKIDGETFQTSQGVKNGTFTQSFEAGDGKRINEYSLEQGGQVLRVKIHVVSDKLPHPLNYELTYRRSSGGK